MTDRYRLLVLSFVILWCCLSLPCSSWGQQCGDMPYATYLNNQSPECDLRIPVDVARLSPAMMGSVPVAGGKTCALDSVLFIDQFTTSDYFKVGCADATAANSTYGGQGNYDPVTNKVVCSVDINIRNVSGAADYYVEIFPMSGNNLGTLDTVNCRSASVNIASSGTKSFTGLNCPLTGGSYYAFTIVRTDHSFNASACLDDGVYRVNATTWSGNAMSWSGALVNTWSNAAFEFSIKVYGYDP